MITAPVIHELGSPPTHEDRAGRVQFVLELPGRPGRLDGLPVRVGPLVQPVAIVAAEEIVGVGDVPVERTSTCRALMQTLRPPVVSIQTGFSVL